LLIPHGLKVLDSYDGKQIEWFRYGTIMEPTKGVAMATITIKDIPDALYRRLKLNASEHRRSLNKEVIICLEQSTGSVPLDPETFLARAQEIRKLVKGPRLSERRLKQLKSAGRL
jgi:antitoxin FitA